MWEQGLYKTNFAFKYLTQKLDHGRKMAVCDNLTK